MNQEKNKPHVGRVGRVRFKIWTNPGKDGKVRHSVEIFRSYRVEKDGSAAWKDAHSFSQEDMKDLPYVLSEIENHLAGQQ